MVEMKIEYPNGRIEYEMVDEDFEEMLILVKEISKCFN